MEYLIVISQLTFFNIWYLGVQVKSVEVFSFLISFVSVFSFDFAFVAVLFRIELSNVKSILEVVQFVSVSGTFI